MIELFGFPLGSPFQGATLLAVLGAIIIWWIRGMPARAKVQSDREANLLHERAEEMASMRERIAKLEKQQNEKDQAHAKEIDELQEIHAAKERYHDALRGHSRHRINNLNQAFMALLLLLKKGVPVEEAVEEVEAMRAEQLQREADELATIQAAAIKAGIERDDV